MLLVGVGSLSGSAFASISLGSTGDSIAVQLRGNQDNNDIVTLFTRSYSGSGN